MSSSPHLAAFFEGYLFFSGIVIAIGAQNAFLLKQGLKREQVLLCVSFCSLADITLIATGVLGMHTITTIFPGLVQLVLWAGVCFLFGYGLHSFYLSYKGASVEQFTKGVAETKKPKGKMTCLMILAAVTFLNPHVYLDTVFLIGSLATAYPAGVNWSFAYGAMAASVGWFFSLGYGARLLLPFFKHRTTWRVLEGVIGCLMWGLAAKLLLDLNALTASP